MDDFKPSMLYESKNEWGVHLLNILTPLIIEGVYSIFNESVKTCRERKEESKYLMTFQNFISCIPKWNQTMIDAECERIVKKSNCTYLDELISCVHIIQLKILTAVRVSSEQKKMDIEIPKLNKFVHNVYINVARQIYKNAYLFSVNISELQSQKNRHDIEQIVRECILNTIRDSIPIETILKVYVDESSAEVVEEIKDEIIPIPSSGGQPSSQSQPIISDTMTPSLVVPPSSSISFNDIDSTMDTTNSQNDIVAPKNIERLEQISAERNLARKQDDDDDDDEHETLTLSDEPVSINFDDIGPPSSTSGKKTNNVIINNIDILD
jgi:hypothetical protein